MNMFTILLVLTALATSSMQRSADSNGDILGAWVFNKVEFVFNEDLDAEEKEFIELFMIPMLEEGLSYAQLNFYPDGTMRSTLNTPDENTEDIGNWHLSADGKVLTMHSDEGADAHDVHLLNDTDMILALAGDEGMTMILHLKKI